MRQTFFEDKIADDRFVGQLYGLGGGSAVPIINPNTATNVAPTPLASSLAQLILDGGASDRTNGISNVAGGERK